MIKSWLMKCLNNDTEHKQVLRYIHKLAPAPAKILDVGCGYGSYLAPLQQQGHAVLGVEKNARIVAENRDNGLNCCTPEHWQETCADERYDIILFSHIIEHFSPDDLVALLDGYLAQLKPGGHCIIATPLMSPYFYDDFDHVKPYQPTGILMVFGGQAQVQYDAKTRLSLEQLCYRRSPWQLSHIKSFLLRTPFRHLSLALNVLGILLYWGSCRILARKDGWIGVFCKAPTVQAQ